MQNWRDWYLENQARKDFYDGINGQLSWEIKPLNLAALALTIAVCWSGMGEGLYWLKE